MRVEIVGAAALGAELWQLATADRIERGYRALSGLPQSYCMFAWPLDAEI
jgi:hypothetical protein